MAVDAGGVGHGAEPFEAVEDQVEPELELVAVVVAGLQDVLGGQLGEVGVLLGGESRQDRLCDLPDGVGVKRQGGFLEGEPRPGIALNLSEVRAVPVIAWQRVLNRFRNRSRP